MREHIGYHLIKPRYYDQPEGKDLFGKLVITNAYMGTVGVIWSTYDVLMLTKPQGYFNTFSRYAYHTGPFMGMATAFTLTTYLANKFRGKDDTYVKHCLIFRLVICGIIVFFFSDGTILPVHVLLVQFWAPGNVMLFLVQWEH